MQLQESHFQRNFLTRCCATDRILFITFISHSTLHFLKCAYLPPGTPDLWFITRTSHIPHILPALFLSHEHLGISGDLPTLPPNSTTLCLTSLGSHPGQDCRVLRHMVNLTRGSHLLSTLEWRAVSHQQCMRASSHHILTDVFRLSARCANQRDGCRM